MKKTMIYASLCATVMIPSILFATEEKGIEEAVRKERKRLEETNRFTPKKKEIEQKFSNPCLSPDTRNRFIKSATELAEKERDQKISSGVKTFQTNLLIEAKKEEERKLREEKKRRSPSRTGTSRA